MYRLEPMTAADWPEVRAIFAEGIATGYATLENEPPAWDDWDRSHLAQARLVARAADPAGVAPVRATRAGAGGAILGWAALTPVSGRCVYAGVAEVSVYVAAAARGRGVGRVLLDGLVAASEQAGLWTLQAGVFPENAGSLALHRACGFREVGRRERIGRQRGRWQDVVLLERRSRVVGTD